jgi:membrane associated rhomboid family serine protease
MAMSFKGAVLLFVIVAAGAVVYGLARGHALGETMIAAAMLGAFVIGVAAVAKLADARVKRK